MSTFLLFLLPKQKICFIINSIYIYYFYRIFIIPSETTITISAVKCPDRVTCGSAGIFRIKEKKYLKKGGGK